MPRRDPMERFWEKVLVTDRFPLGADRGPCWEWQATLHKGYGQFRLEGQIVYAHRYSYELAKGAIPVGLEPDHLCRYRRCVNPDHLEPVTHLENVQRARGYVHPRSLRTHCLHGHAYTEENTYRDRYGNRRCRTCGREANRRYKERLQAKPAAAGRWEDGLPTLMIARPGGIRE